ncbi:MAG: prolyl oligopeptidase family serine peptidase [Phycisphaerales bacterium]|nr:prolyl oligopeptidase family serine peptidase [Phycisphaerales bacterium]
MNPRAIGFFGVLFTTVALHAAPPETKREPVTDTLHGVKLVDDYRWLEGDNSDPKEMGKLSPEVAAWTDAQNAYTRGLLDTLPGRKALEDRLRPLMEIGSISAPAMRRNRYFYTRREGKESQPRVFVREGYKGEPRLLLDPGALDADGLTALGGYWPSQDGKYLAFGLYRAGDENTTVYVLDVDTGRWLADEIPGKAGGVNWMPDNSGFFYERLADIKNPYSAQVKFHRLGTHQRMDPMLFRQYTKEENEKLATTWGPGASISRDARWMILSYWTGTSSNDIWCIDLDRWFRTGEFVKNEIMVGADATFGGSVVGDTLLMQTNHEAPNGKVVAVDLNNPAKANWREFIPERKDAVLDSFSVARGVIAADYQEKATTRYMLFDMSGKPLSNLALPGIGSAGLQTEEDRTEAFLTFTSFNYPNTVFRVDLANPGAAPELWERPAVPVDPETVEVKQVTYSSKDGTPVTMFIVHKKGLVLNGNNPTILNGYGGFNISMNPSFSATLFPWFEDGGVFALPNLRGGGEYGKAWHEGGMLANKQNVFDDFAAAAKYLFEQKYTNPSKLAITGGSNGGLLTGTLVTQNPDLFAAAIVAVPLLDMIRYQDFLMARYWVPEYGTAENKDHFEFILKYSPYQNIKAGTKYPAVMVTAGENDTRVHPMHARKMAAALQAATTSDPNTRPVLLWVDREAGHGQGKPLHLRLRDIVDQRMFIMWQLGMIPGKPVSALPGNEDAANAAAPIAAMGAMRSLSFNVKGMTCVGCAAEVEEILGAFEGVESVKVDLKGAKAKVNLRDGASPDVKAMVSSLKEKKFTATATGG